ncbi:MAG: hypothetical protein BAA03_12890 [Caldibacillus debilis]|nr:MAG: hypothetical protein BAA03_12890 [Caldibacillus debilis]
MPSGKPGGRPFGMRERGCGSFPGLAGHPGDNRPGFSSESHSPDRRGKKPPYRFGKSSSLLSLFPPRRGLLRHMEGIGRPKGTKGKDKSPASRSPSETRGFLRGVF